MSRPEGPGSPRRTRRGRPPGRAGVRLVAGALGVALAAGPGCGGHHAPAREGPPHPLVGRIWSVAEQRALEEPALLERLSRHRYVLLGEVHDNPAHHRLQARVLRGLSAQGRHPAVVFEMIDVDRGPALATALARPDPRPDDVRHAVAWDASGWPDFALYAPVFEAALDARLAIAAGDLATADRDALRRDGLAGLDPARRAALGVDVPLDAAQQAALLAAIRTGHCDLLPESALPRLVAFQRARDGQLARALVDAVGSDGAVLIAGAGHARGDVGVPAVLARLDPDAAVASLALVEVEEGVDDPARLLAGRFDGSTPFDFAWFTPRAPREDPCEALRRRLAAPETR